MRDHCHAHYDEVALLDDALIDTLVSHGPLTIEQASALLKDKWVFWDLYYGCLPAHIALLAIVFTPLPSKPRTTTKPPPREPLQPVAPPARAPAPVLPSEHLHRTPLLTPAPVHPPYQAPLYSMLSPAIRQHNLPLPCPPNTAPRRSYNTPNIRFSDPSQGPPNSGDIRHRHASQTPHTPYIRPSTLSASPAYPVTPRAVKRFHNEDDMRHYMHAPKRLRTISQGIPLRNDLFEQPDHSALASHGSLAAPLVGYDQARSSIPSSASYHELTTPVLSPTPSNSSAHFHLRLQPDRYSSHPGITSIPSRQPIPTHNSHSVALAQPHSQFVRVQTHAAQDEALRSRPPTYDHDTPLPATPRGMFAHPDAFHSKMASAISSTPIHTTHDFRSGESQTHPPPSFTSTPYRTPVMYPTTPYSYMPSRPPVPSTPMPPPHLYQSPPGSTIYSDSPQHTPHPDDRYLYFTSAYPHPSHPDT